MLCSWIILTLYLLASILNKYLKQCCWPLNYQHWPNEQEVRKAAWLPTSTKESCCLWRSDLKTTQTHQTSLSKWVTSCKLSLHARRTWRPREELKEEKENKRWDENDAIALSVALPQVLMNKNRSITMKSFREINLWTRRCMTTLHFVLDHLSGHVLLFFSGLLIIYYTIHSIHCFSLVFERTFYRM